MEYNSEKVKNELNNLVKRGNHLQIALLYENTPEAERRELASRLKEENIDIAKMPKFSVDYEAWYSKALQYIKRFLPDRVADFVILYKNEKRKEITSLTYTISDAIIGVRARMYGDTIAEPISAMNKMQQQVAILNSAKEVIDSAVYSMDFAIRSDLFDSELAAAGELLKSGFFRASGAMCGVVLEKHLGYVCEQHGLSSRKKAPTINDYNEVLKNASVIDLPTWRHIQWLGDLRNLCCHDKSVEPTKEQVTDLLEGVIKISKTVN